MSRRAHWLSGAMLAGAAWLACGRAAADPSDRKAAAELLFQEGRTLEEQGNHAEACPKLAESLRLDAALGTMLWLADCYERNGQLASAWAQFREAAGAAALRKDGREKVAMTRARDLEPRLSKLKIVVATPAPGLELRRDGAIVGAAEQTLEVPVDPGAHAIGAAAPGKVAWSRRVEVTTPGTTIVNVPALEDVPREEAAPLRAVTTPSEPARMPSVVPEMPAGRTQRTIGLIVGGTGILAVGVGAAFGIVAKSSYDSSNEAGHCLPDNRCDGTGLARRSEASTQAAAATVLFGAGVAAVISGGLLYLVSPRAHEKTGLKVAPLMTAGGGGLTVGRAW